MLQLNLFSWNRHFWPLYRGQRSNQGQGHITFAVKVSGHFDQVWSKSINIRLSYKLSWQCHARLTERKKKKDSLGNRAFGNFRCQMQYGILHMGMLPNVFFSCLECDKDRYYRVWAQSKDVIDIMTFDPNNPKRTLDVLWPQISNIPVKISQWTCMCASDVTYTFPT